MASFNTKHLKKQELLSKEDCQFLLELLAEDCAKLKASMERLQFLRAKLKRMMN